MKLSMYMIMRRLPFEKIKCNIQDGDQRICGVRLIAENLGFYPDDYVYVANDVQTVPSRGSSEIILIHRNNTIVISGHTLEEVLNEVLAILDYYNNWETELFKAVVQGLSLQKITEMAAPVFHSPLVVTVRSGKVVGFSDTEGKYDFDDLWRTVRTKGYIPPFASSNAIIDQRGKVVKEWGLQPQFYTMGERRVIGARVQKDGETFCSFYLQEFERKLDPADIQLAEVLYEALSSYQPGLTDEEELYTASALVESLIEGASPEGMNTEYLDALLQQKKPYQLALIKSSRENYDEMHFVFLIELLRKQLRPSLALSYKGQVLCITGAAESKAIEKKLAGDIDLRHYNIGISNAFTEWGYLKKCYAQAKLASEHTFEEMPVCQYNSIALEQMLGQLKMLDGQIGVLDPALYKLLQTDQANDTEYFQTLKVFLLQERNMSRSARLLNIHLNTMKYRIQRILEITGIDLDDMQERLHLLLSFLVYGE